MATNVLITGATGKVGGELARLLLADGISVKAGSRTPDRARRLIGADAEIVELDYDATETWDAAVQWADRIFLVAPPFDPHADEQLVPFLDWAVQSGTQHLVLVSAMSVETRERLTLRRVEQRIENTGVGWTFLRPNIYMQNFARGFVAREIRGYGSFHLSTGDGETSFVDARDVAAVAAEVLKSDDHFGRAYTLTGPAALDHDRVARIIAQVAGRDVRYESVSSDEMRSRLIDDGWQPDHADIFLGLLESIREGERAQTTNDVERLLGRAPTSFEDFARDHADAWR